MDLLILTDSRARSATGKRTIYKFEPTPAGVYEAWTLVLNLEVEEHERQDYTGLFDCDQTEIDGGDAAIVFNDYWSVYGWYLNVYDGDTPQSDDEIVGHRPEALEGGLT